MRKSFTILIFGFLFLASCNVVQVMKKINSTSVDIKVFESDKKVMLFIPMVHIGKPEFYSEVYKTVDSLKAAGFVAFHEGTKPDSIDHEQTERIYKWIEDRNYLGRYYNGSHNKDSIADDVYMRKLRKMLGFYRDSLRYAELFHEKGVFKGLVDQPRYHEMKTDSRDLNVDVSIYDIIEEYERRFGEIALSESDFAHLLSSKGSLAKSERLPMKQVKEAILDFRDQYLAQQIQSSPHNNIVVIYGLAHLDGTFDHLKKLDKSWVKRND